MSWFILGIVAFLIVLSVIGAIIQHKKDNITKKHILIVLAIILAILAIPASIAENILSDYISDKIHSSLFGENIDDESDSSPNSDIEQPDLSDNINELYSVGDIFTFGSYEQDNNLVNGSEPIEWIVLSVEDDRMLVISKFALDCKPYNDTQTEVTWESCTLRKWLNDEFINTAFSKEEQNYIIPAILDNPENPSWGTDGGNQTVDRIFCLSLEDLPKVFDSSFIGAATPTDTAISHGCYKIPDSGQCAWWLRSPGYSLAHAAQLEGDGSINLYGENVKAYDTAVRPAFYYSLIDIQTESENEFSYGNAAPFSSSVTYSAGDYFTFGRYEQDNNLKNGTEDIEWLVLSAKADELLVISRYGLDSVPYNNTSEHVAWESCSLRSWLNNEFLYNAFSEDRINMINPKTIDNPSHAHFDNEGCEPTNDILFCLSFQEVECMGEIHKAYKHSMPTEYAKANGAYVDTDDSWMWWLRTLGNGSCVAACDSNSYKSDTYESEITMTLPAVRPVCYIKLDK